jgi:hypothetical protein
MLKVTGFGDKLPQFYVLVKIFICWVTWACHFTSLNHSILACDMGSLNELQEQRHLDWCLVHTLCI